MRPVFLALLFVLIRPLSGVRGDEVELVSGGRLSCEVVKEADDHVEVRLPHGEMRIPRDRIRRIVREEKGAYLKREGQSSLRAGSTKSAVELFERALEADPEDGEAKDGLMAALLAHARYLVGSYRLSEAVDVLERLHGLDPQSPDVAALAKAIEHELDAGARLYAAALQAIEQGQFALALRQLDAWRLRRPVGDPRARREMAAAHLMAGQAALNRGGLREALDHFRSAEAFGDRRRTDLPLYLLRPIAVLEAIKEGETERAARLIDSIATTYPDRVVPVFLRAVLHHVKGEVRQAVSAYAESARLAEIARPGRGGIPYTEVRRQASATLREAIAHPPREGVTRWRETFLRPLRRDDGAKHFVVFAATERQAAGLGEAADEVYERIARELLGGIPASARAELVLHPTRGAYVSADPVPANSPLEGLTVPRAMTGGVTYNTLDADGKPLVRIELFADSRLLEDALPHEVTHLVQRRGLGAYRRGHWLDEGLAMLRESEAGRRGRIEFLLQQEEPLPLPELLALRSTPPGKARLFYCQAYALTAYLKGLGTPRDWSRFLDRYANKGFEPAVKEVYRVESVDVLEREWRASLGLSGG